LHVVYSIRLSLQTTTTSRAVSTKWFPLLCLIL
jgi:hypothetical protein